MQIGKEIDNMGSVGQNTNTNNNVIDATNRFKRVPDTQTEPQEFSVSRGNGWNYPGITQRINDLENAYNNARSASRKASILKALEAQDRTITNEMNNGDGDKTVLMSQRRRVRQLMRKVKNNE